MKRLLCVGLSGLVVLGIGRCLAGDNQPPEDFAALFNGRDLASWEAKGDPKGKSPDGWQDHWKVVGGVIRYDGKSTNLWTRKSFSDFVLMVDRRLPGRSDSGIYLRGTPKCQANNPVEFKNIFIKELPAN